jgi:16S rRNA processing protein RimM
VSEYDIQVGRVATAHGLKGLVRVAPSTDIPDRCRTLKEVMVKTARAARLHRVLAAKEIARGAWLMRLEGIEDRTQAEALRGAALLVREEDSPRLPEGIYYRHQIIGLRVVTTDGREVGAITDIIETGANDVYVTAAALIPAIPQVVKALDLETGTMLIEPMPGLLPED